MSLKYQYDPILRTKTSKVTSFRTVPDLYKTMVTVMQENGGCGLAANQIGVDASVIIYDLGDGPRMLINPVVSKNDDAVEVMSQEGCLSIPGQTVEIPRWDSIYLEAIVLDDFGKPHTFGQYVDGFEAIVIQHEVDHLNGILMTDHIRA